MVGFIRAAVGNVTSAAGCHAQAGGLSAGSGGMGLRFLQRIAAGMINAVGGIVDVLNILLLGGMVIRVKGQIFCVADLANAHAVASGNAAFANTLHYGDTAIGAYTVMLLHTVYHRVFPRTQLYMHITVHRAGLVTTGSAADSRGNAGCALPGAMLMEYDFIVVMQYDAVIAVGMQILVFGVGGAEGNIARLLGRDPNLRTRL